MKAGLTVASITAAAALVFLPQPWSAALAGACVLALATGRRASRLALPLAACAAVAAVLGFTQWRLEAGVGHAGWRQSAEGRLARIVDRLEREADRVASVLEEELSEGSRLSAFDVLRDAAAGGSELSYLLYDASAEAIAWSGEGLLHDPATRPAAGIGFVSSFEAATLFYVRQLAGQGPAWHLTVGQSFTLDRLPFPPGAGVANQGFSWIVLDEADETEPLTLDSGRGLRISLRELPHPSRVGPLRGLARLAAAIFGAALLTGALSLCRGLVVDAPVARLQAAALGTAGFMGIAAAAGATRVPLAAMAAIGAVAVAAMGAGSRLGPATTLLARLGFGALLPLAFAIGYQLRVGVLPLGESLFVAGGESLLRVATCVPVLAALLLPPPRWGLGWSVSLTAGLGGLLGAAAMLDRPELAGPLLALAIIAGPIVNGPRSHQRGLGVWIGSLVFAMLLGAVAWEASGHWLLRRAVAERSAEPRPGLAERAAQLRETTVAYLESPEVAALLDRAPDTGVRDLAVALWRRSPLTRSDSLSALSVTLGPGPPATFSFGLPVYDGAFDLAGPEDLGGADDEWAEAEVEVRALGSRVARVRFWVAPLPGPRADELVLDGLFEDLLLGGATGGVPPATYPGRARLATDGTDTLVLPRLGATAGLERVAVHAVGTLLLAVALALFGALLGLGDGDFRLRLRSFLVSYPRRLIVIYALLIVLPLLLLNLVLFRAMGERLRAEHREAGEVSLVVAQRVLSDYLLALDPGFGLRTVLEQEVLDWLSSVVDQEVNVYWGSEYFASSLPALFTANLLPQRIPGDVYSDLVLRQADTAARTRSAQGSSYLELYAVLELPEIPQASERRFYLSTLLPAQEEEVAAQLGALSRQAFLVTTGLLLLMLAVSARLAAGFTRPVMEIVEGTDRIARGEPSLRLDPTEPELRTLVSAIDQMAARIASGREELIREKQVMEQVVENITASVVSLDRERRVLMHNRVAEQLLGARVGETIDAIAEKGSVPGLAEFLADVDDSEAPISARLGRHDEEELEWSAVWVPVPGDGEPTALLVIEDVTEILRAQRLEAWAEMARIIAHEVKNPLTPIRLSTEHMREVFESSPERFREVFERCTDNILAQVGELRDIAGEFSTYSRVPSMDLEPGDLLALTREVVDGYLAAPPPGVEIELRSELAAAAVRCDDRLLGRALRNLLENAIRVSGGNGRVDVEVAEANGRVWVEVSDRGPGVRPEDLSRIFDPYFSTHDAGTGLGLPIAKRIVEGHGGSIQATNRNEGGLRVRIDLPRA